MSFADSIVSADIQQLRAHILGHSLWRRIEEGTLEPERLRLFALQDWWLVREAYRLDALAIAALPDLEIQDLLIRKLTPKVGGYKLLLRFGEALGLSRADFDAVEPLAGCMALTNFFYWMLAYGAPAEKLASVSASEDIFVQICARIAPTLIRHYNLTAEQVEFFSAHDAIGEQVTPVDETLLARYNSPEDQQRITRAIRLSHEYEIMFYDTILTAKIGS
ncbi:TenA family transcriptional regulator [Ktedonobacter racemifer]|uniref:Transcriptional activator, TenA family n=1 Tax=Ktedonobacter racemifer DSM 44963 TaxID=485913 RepID=D6TIP8_KTERA|nr:iron-containing redox enzyme family protein [Ktedonobacter racemifer]EFH89305.1 transcriptional activator, TenA family [Ktedonobacter racemifer DSM 44963]